MLKTLIMPLKKMTIMWQKHYNGDLQSPQTEFFFFFLNISKLHAYWVNIGTIFMPFERFLLFE